MSNLAPQGMNFNITMSSREIAELCEKQHKHVLRDIEAMLGQINGPNFGPVEFEAQYQDAKGEWRKEFRLPKDLTVTLITGYRADLRYKVVKRLEELENAKVTPAILSGPQLMAAALIEADATMRVQAQQIEAMRDDVTAFERIGKADGSLCFRDAAKSLQVRPIDLTRVLQSNRWIYRQSQNGPWIGYQDKVSTGYLEHKVTMVDRADGVTQAVTQCRVTPKGMVRLAKLIGGVA